MLSRLDGNSSERRQAEIFTILRRAGWRGSLGHVGGKLHRLFTGSKHGLVVCRHGRLASTFAPRHTCWQRYSSRCRRHKPRMLLHTVIPLATTLWAIPLATTLWAIGKHAAAPLDQPHVLRRMPLVIIPIIG